MWIKASIDVCVIVCVISTHYMAKSQCTPGTFPGKVFHNGLYLLDCVCENLCPFSQNSICKIRQDKKAWLTISVSSFHHNSSQCYSFYWRDHGFAQASHWNSKVPSPNCCPRVGITQLAKMSLCHVALRGPFIEPNGNSPNPEKKPKAIIHPSSDFSVGTMHSSRKRSPWHPTNPDLSIMLWNSDTCFHSSTV